MNYIIGVDFDNTIISYDRLIYKIATERSLIDLDFIGKSKKKIRDAIRLLEDGEIKWQKLQATIYGPRIDDAELMTGVLKFFENCKHKALDIYIISHKSEYANYDDNGTNLRKSALAWMNQNLFLKTFRLGLNREKVYFESTQRDKIDRIKQLKCTHFIDDLEEIFMNDSFPANVKKILYDPHGLYSNKPEVTICKSWDEIGEKIFTL